MQNATMYASYTCPILHNLLEYLLLQIFIWEYLYRAWKFRLTWGIQLNKSICMCFLLYADDIVLIQENEDYLQRAICFNYKKQQEGVLTDNFSEKD